MKSMSLCAVLVEISNCLSEGGGIGILLRSDPIVKPHKLFVDIFDAHYFPIKDLTGISGLFTDRPHLLILLPVNASPLCYGAEATCSPLLMGSRRRVSCP